MSPQSMQGEAFLLTVAVVSLALAGFASVIQTFRRETEDPRDRDRQKAGVEFILQHTFAACFFALFPFLLFYGGNCEQQVWAISSASLAIVLFAILYRHISLVINLRRRHRPPRMFIPLIAILFGTLVILVLQLSNLWNPLLSKYASGVFWLLVAAGGQFFSSFRFLLSNEN